MDLSRRRFALVLGSTVGAGLLGRSGPAGPTPGSTTEVGPMLLDSNENPSGPSLRAREAMTRSQAVASRYPDALTERMRQTIARHHGLAPENVCVGCGSTEILRMADMAFLGAGRTLVAATTTFEAVLDFAGVAQGRPIQVPLDAAFRHDLPAMARASTSRTGLVYVCNPNNPTGTIVPGREFDALVAAVPRSAVILVDEAYHHYVEDPEYRSAVSWVGQAENVIVARTFSKIHGMAGMRLGYALGSPEYIRAMQSHAIFSGANAAVLAAAEVSLGDEAHVREQRQRNRETRVWLETELRRQGLRFIPSHTNFLMIHVGTDVAPLIQAFRDRGIRVGRRFPSMAEWLRISIGAPEEIRAFAAALAEILPAARAA
jgi:histidinol-phosphate aminotransferase